MTITSSTPVETNREVAAGAAAGASRIAAAGASGRAASGASGRAAAGAYGPNRLY